MKELVEHIAKSLVSQPEKVVVTVNQVDNVVNIELRTAPEDMGKVIGKQGRIAKAMRSVVKAAGNKANVKVNLDIL